MPEPSRIYLDHNATTPICPEVRVFMDRLRDSFPLIGNASSPHAEGRRARRLVEDARDKVAALFAAEPRDVVFTSGATEANNLAIWGCALKEMATGHRRPFLVSATEHPSVSEPAKLLTSYGIPVTTLPVDKNGAVDVDFLRDALRRAGAAMICVQHANHETGVLQPLAAILATIRGAAMADPPPHLHVDVVQSCGHMAIDFPRSGIDSMAISGHKIYGPSGVGALLVRVGAELVPLLRGGLQERGRRPGTENAAALAGFGEACRVVANHVAGDAKALAALRDRLEAALLSRCPEAAAVGAGAQRIPGTSCIRFSGTEAQSVVAALDLAGVAAAAGSACASGSPEPSAVLRAMHFSEQESAEGVRFSLGRETSIDIVDDAAVRIPAVVRQVREFLNV